MSKTKISRKEMLKKPDEFISLSTRAIDFVKDHKRQFDYLGMAVLGLIIIYLGINAYTRYINKKGQEAFNTAFYAMTNNTGKTAADPKKTEELFSDVINKYGMSKAAKLAVPELAYSKFEQKQYDEAISRYEEYLNKTAEDSPYKSLARLSLAACYEQKGEYEKAIETLEKIMGDKDDSIKEQAMLSLARAYRLAGKQDKLADTIKQFNEKFPKSVFLDLINASQK